MNQALERPGRELQRCGRSLKTCSKLNLSLQIGQRRPDGYHNLRSLVVFCEVGDTLHSTLRPAPPAIAGPNAAPLTLSGDGPFAHRLPAPENNLALRAAQALQQAGQVRAGAHLHLTKRLPPASGVGGGSGDAALALQQLTQLWDLPHSPARLAALGLTLGADIPVCLHGRACLMEGVGEKLTPLPPLPPLYAVLVNPGVALDTGAMFHAYAQSPRGLAGSEGAFYGATTTMVPFPCAFAAMGNDLLAPAMAQCPKLASMLQTLAAQPGCLLAQMSGSGATCFGLFAAPETREAAAAAVARRYPDDWVASGRVH